MRVRHKPFVFVDLEVGDAELESGVGSFMRFGEEHRQSTRDNPAVDIPLRAPCDGESFTRSRLPVRKYGRVIPFFLQTSAGEGGDKDKDKGLEFHT